MKTVPCKGCGAPLVWAVNPATGKRVPLDARSVVYQLVEQLQVGAEPKLEAIRKPNHFVSHFQTCPKAAEFSRSKKKPVDERAAELDAEREMADDRSWENR